MATPPGQAQHGEYASLTLPVLTASFPADEGGSLWVVVAKGDLKMLQSSWDEPGVTRALEGDWD